MAEICHALHRRTSLFVLFRQTSLRNETESAYFDTSKVENYAVWALGSDVAVGGITLMKQDSSSCIFLFLPLASVSPPPHPPVRAETFALAAAFFLQSSLTFSYRMVMGNDLRVSVFFRQCDIVSLNLYLFYLILNKISSCNTFGFWLTLLFLMWSYRLTCLDSSEVRSEKLRPIHLLLSLKIFGALLSSSKQITLYLN
jgi:hypothetical protein